jgi:hypothetical protein
MKTVNSNSLLENLQINIRNEVLLLNQLQQIPITILQQQPTVGKWSIAQVLEHLNIYSRYYNTAIEKKLHLNNTVPHKNFTPGWLGNYFTKLMLPTKEHTIAKKMKAPKNATPTKMPNAKVVLEECIQQQQQLLNLLAIAKSVNLQQHRIPTSLSKLITLKLGDTFRFLIAHQERHFLQISNILAIVYPNQSFAA